MTPEETLKLTTAYLKELEKAKRLSVAVGLPEGEATRAIYNGGPTVVEVGSYHEYGEGVPVRSFLRVPFKIHKEKISNTLTKLFKQIAEGGKSAENQMELAGVVFQNISKESFETRGYGTWQDITEETKEAKKSSGILIDTGILRGSITYEVCG